MKTTPNTMQLEEIAYILKAVSQSTRLHAVQLLANNHEMSVSQMVEIIKCEQSLLSHHLTDMRAKGILSCRREGKNCFYSLKNKLIKKVIDCIHNCEQEQSL